MFRQWIAATLLLSALAVAQTHSPSTVPPSLLAHLRHGINLSEWFAQVYDPKGYTKEHFESWTTPADIALIKSAGFDHVRLSVNPQPMMDAAQRQGGTAEYFAYLDTAMKMILDAGLAVELDVHPDSDFKARLKDDDFVERFADFWRTLSKHYASWDSDRIFFEILNEPEMTDSYRWYGVEAKLAAAIRQGSPTHTILATAARWDDDGDLLSHEPLRDPNVIYVFHFYQPQIFTHQGANWSVYYWHSLEGLHYPSDPKNAAQVAESLPDAVHRLDVIRYGQEHWDTARIEAEINQAADWAHRNNVPLVCNEFGVYHHANPQDRARWIKDVRTSLEHHNIGWAMWDFSSDSFGVATKREGNVALDEATLKALGLR